MKEINRRDFLKITAVGMGAVLGLTTETSHAQDGI